MFDLVSAVFVLAILVVGIISFNHSIKRTNINAEIEDSSVNTHEDILIFKEFQQTALARGHAEESGCIGEKVIAMKKCDAKIVSLSKRINKKKA